MKNLFILLLLVCLSQFTFSQETKSRAEIQKEMKDQFLQYNGEKLSDFKLLSSDGKIKKLSDFKYKVVLLDFWATWCGACINHIPDQEVTYKRLKEKYKTDFEWINISVDKDTSAWRTLLETRGKAGVNLIGNIDFIQATYHVEHYPTLVLIDNRKKIIGFDIPRLSWKGPQGPVFLEFLISKAMNGINSGDAYIQMSNTETNTASEEFLKWLKLYYLESDTLIKNNNAL